MRLTPICSDLADLPQIGYILVIFSASAESPPRSSVSGSDLYISDVPDQIPRSIHCKSAVFRSFTRNRLLPLTRVREPDRPNIFSQSDLYKSFQIDMDTQIYLGSSASIFFIDWDFLPDNNQHGSCLRCRRSCLRWCPCIRFCPQQQRSGRLLACLPPRSCRP